MPATALRHPEIESDAFDADFDAPQTVVYAPPRRSVPAPPEGNSGANVEWGEVAPLVERFAGASGQTERRERRVFRKRHRTFVMSGVFLAGTLLLAELVGLVWLGALDLAALNRDGKLDDSIARTTVELRQSESRFAASKSSTQLEQWAAPLGYHKADLAEMDDVTSNAKASAPIKATP